MVKLISRYGGLVFGVDTEAEVSQLVKAVTNI